MKNGRVVKLDGRSMRLCYTLNALCDAERATGLSFEQILSMRCVFTDLRALLWCGLIEYQPALTQAGVGEMIDRELARGNTLEGLVGLCMETLTEQAFFRSAPADGQGNESARADDGAAGARE